MFIRIACLLFTAMISCNVTAQDASDELIELIVGFLHDDDKDTRALAFEQIRSEAKGLTATKAFAAALSKLPPESQAGLLRALAGRGDQAARAAVLELLSSTKDAAVRSAAIESIGSLGEPDDTKLLMKILSGSSKEDQATAQQSLISLRGSDVSNTLAAELKNTSSRIRITILEILVAQRAIDTISAMLPVAVDRDPAVRQAAMTALGKIAGPEHVPAMIQGVLKAEEGKERESAEKCVMFVCKRIDDPEKRAAPVFAAMEKLSSDQRTILLSTLGRIGGSDALKSIEAAIAESSTHSAGLRAICNWPDATIVPRLIELIHTDKHPGHATTVLRALIRVAPLPDERTNAERLELLQRAMAMCTRDTERNLVLDRCRAVRTLDSLKYILPYVDGPAYTKQACLSVVELAHDRELRDTNKAAFHRALDWVMKTSKDPIILDRAQRYKNGQTWVRPGK